MKEEPGTSWIENLTEIVLELEELNSFRPDLVQDLAMTFFDKAVEICTILYELDDDPDAPDGENPLVDRLMQSGRDLIAGLSHLDRSAEASAGEISFEMYRFISLLSQRLNFEAR